MRNSRFATIALTATFVLLFGIFGIEKFTSPTLWIGFVPSWMDGLLGLPKTSWLSQIGTLEIILAVLLLVPIRIVRKAGAALITLNLLTIAAILFQQSGFSADTVRDFCLSLASVGLFLLI